MVTFTAAALARAAMKTPPSASLGGLPNRALADGQIVLGVDPGTLATGYAFLETRGGLIRVLEYGVIRCRQEDALPLRLGRISDGLRSLMVTYHPSAMALESIFFAKFPRSALILGHARGAIMVAAQSLGVTVAEYAPRLVKQSVVGRGGASKEQVGAMIKSHLRLKEAPAPADAADALAIAFCHLIQASRGTP